jgi:hypothetical protein
MIWLTLLELNKLFLILVFMTHLPTLYNELLFYRKSPKTVIITLTPERTRCPLNTEATPLNLWPPKTSFLAMYMGTSKSRSSFCGRFKKTH